MSYDTNNNWSVPLFTATTFSATGATSLVAAPGAGYHIAVDGLRVVPTVDTSSDQDISFRSPDTTTATLMFRSLSTLTDTASWFSADLQTPWVLPTNSALQAVLSITAASTPGAYVEGRYRTVRVP